MSPEELETRLAHGEKFISHKTLDWYLQEQAKTHSTERLKLQRDEILFTRKILMYSWCGWLLTILVLGAI